MAANASWGIEVGAGAIKALKLVAKGDGFEVAEYAIVPHKKVLSTPDLDQDEATRLALGALVNHYDLSGATVVMSVPGHAAFARFAKLPPVEPKKVPQIVRFEAQQQIPFPLEEVEWDYQTFRSPNSPDIEAGIFAITKQRINERLAVCQDVGITPDVVTLSPVAAYNALIYDLNFSEETPGAIILDIGTTSTDLIVAEAGRVWIRTVPIGGHNFTQALVEKFNLSYLKAEKLKREVEQSKHSKHILQALRPVFSDLVQDVQRSIGYYQSLHPDANLTRLVGLGSTFKLPGLRRYLKQQLQLNVYRIDQFKRISVEGAEAANFQEASVNLATAYGLALQGLDSAALEANLMPPAVVREAMWKSKYKWFGVAAGVALLASAAMFYRPLQASSKVEASTPDRIIQQVLNDGRRIRGEASDVTATQVDYTAANIVELDRNRELMAHMVTDVGLMIEDATETARQGAAPPAEGQQAYDVVSFDARYIGPGGVQELSNEQLEELVPGEIRTMPPQLAATLIVETTQPEPTTFVTSTLDRWLRANSERDGVPYRIVPESVSWRQLSARNVAAAEGDDPAAQQQQPDRRPRAGRPAIGRDPAQQRRRSLTGPQDQIIGESQQAANARTMNELAPLPRLLPEPPPGSRITEFEINWRVELVQDEQQGGGA